MEGDLQGLSTGNGTKNSLAEHRANSRRHLRSGTFWGLQGEVSESKEDGSLDPYDFIFGATQMLRKCFRLSACLSLSEREHSFISVVSY